VPCKSVVLAKVVVLSQKCKCLDLECTLNLKALATIAEVKVRSLMKKTNAKTAMERKSRKKRNCSKLKLTRDHPMVANTPSTVKPMNTQELKPEMSL